MCVRGCLDEVFGEFVDRVVGQVRELAAERALAQVELLRAKLAQAWGGGVYVCERVCVRVRVCVRESVCVCVCV